MPFVRTVFSGLAIVGLFGVIWSAWLAYTTRTDSSFFGDDDDWNVVVMLLVLGSGLAVVATILSTLVGVRRWWARAAIVLGVSVLLVVLGGWDYLQVVLDHREADRFGP
jgi:hypothetical protein